MAKKKVNKFSDEASNDIAAKYGDIIKKGTEVLDVIRDKEILSFSPSLDLVLNGGIREGTVVGLAGPPKTGKTTSILHFAAKCQAKGRKVIYLNTEGRLNSQNFDGVKGLSIDNLIIVESTQEKIVPGEDFLSIAEHYIKNLPGCIIIIDSLSSLVPKCELEGNLDAQTRNKLPRLLSQFFKRIGHHVTNNDSIVMCVAHIIADTGPSRRSTMTDCGNMFQYQVQTNLQITHKTPWKIGPDNNKTTVGQEMNWKALTTNTGGIPESEVSGWLRYGVGIDEVKELADIATEFGAIKKAGAWYTISCFVENKEDGAVSKYLQDNNIDPSKEEDVEKAFKFQGGTKLTKFLESNTELFDFLYIKIKEMIC